MATLTFRVVNASIKGIIDLICRVDAAQLARVPLQGPLILVCNHINFLEVPLLYTYLQPRPLTGFAKAETWDNPVMACLFDIWGAIPIRRGEADVEAMRCGLEALQTGKILAIAPEGTRSGDGKLQCGFPGIVLMGLRSGAPMLPVVYYGGETYKSNMKRLKRTEFHILVGRPFYIHTNNHKLTRTLRQDITDEIMFQLAVLLPPENRGHYADLHAASETYLRFPEHSTSNLKGITS